MTSREPTVDASDRELVSRAQRGEIEAFEELVRRYDRKVLSIAYSFTRDADDAKDIYQEVFVRVYGALPRFEAASEFSTWLHRIVMNVCLNHKRRAASAGRMSVEAVAEESPRELSSLAPAAAQADSPERFAEDGEIRRHVEEAMESLSPQERLVFALRHFEGLKLREIAAMIDCSDGAVKRYLFSATGKMRRRLGRIYRQTGGPTGGLDA